MLCLKKLNSGIRKKHNVPKQKKEVGAKYDAVLQQTYTEKLVYVSTYYFDHIQLIN